MRSGPAAIIAALFLAEMTVTFESAMVYAALPTLIRTFGDPVTAGWLITSHLLIAAATAPLAGRLGDIRGRKSLIVILLTVSLIGSVMSAASSSFAVVLVGRALQGLSAAVLPLAIGVVRESIAAEKVPMAVGVLTTAQGAGSALGLVLGGVIVDHLDWQALFWASAILLLLSLVAVMAVVPSRPGTPTRHRIDWIEGLLPLPALSAILLAISMSRDLGWTNPQVGGMLAGGLILMAGWAVRSLRSPEPFIDLRLFADRNIAIANLSSIFLGMGTMQLVFVFSSYVQNPAWTLAGLGLSATVAGLAKLPSNFTSFFAGPMSGWITQKAGLKLPVLIGCGLAAVGWIIGIALPQQLGMVIALLIVISFGTTMLQAAIPNVMVVSVPESRTSEAMGAMSVVRGMASSIGAQIIAVLLASSTIASPTGGAAFPSADAYRLTMTWIAALTIAAGVLGLFLKVRKARPAGQVGSDAASETVPV